MKTPVYIKTTEDKISLPGEEGNNFPPSIKLLNALSPELQRGGEKHVPFAKAGDLVIEGTLYQQNKEQENGKVNGEYSPITFVPLAVARLWKEWKKGERGVLINTYSKEEDIVGHDPAVSEIDEVFDFMVTITSGQFKGRTALLSFYKPSKRYKYTKFFRPMLEKLSREHKCEMSAFEFELSSEFINKGSFKDKPFYNYAIKFKGFTTKEDYLAIEQTKKNVPSLLPEGSEFSNSI
jgi:hypothetical protein